MAKFPGDLLKRCQSGKDTLAEWIFVLGGFYSPLLKLLSSKFRIQNRCENDTSDLDNLFILRSKTKSCVFS